MACSIQAQGGWFKVCASHMSLEPTGGLICFLTSQNVPGPYGVNVAGGCRACSPCRNGGCCDCMGAALISGDSLRSNKMIIRITKILTTISPTPTMPGTVTPVPSPTAISLPSDPLRSITCFISPSYAVSLSLQDIYFMSIIPLRGVDHPAI